MTSLKQFAGAFLGFLLARLSHLDINGTLKNKMAPGEWYWYGQRFYNIGLSIHIMCVIPAGLLAIVQFLPVIRHRLILLHRLNGYLTTLLFLVSNVGALMIARHAFGGTLATQSAVGTLAILTTASILLAIFNIKRLQIDQHRKWMLRCWFYAGSIITVRLIQATAGIIIGRLGSYNQVMPCAQVTYAIGEPQTTAMYPACTADPEGLTIVHADLATPQNAIEAGAALQLSFGMALWLALLLHAVGIETYLQLTPAESERLRRVSYERQLERGLKHPGSAGLTVDRLGDAEAWVPPQPAAKRRGSDGSSESETSDSGAGLVVKVAGAGS